MIQVQSIVDKVKRLGLDSEGSDYYRFDVDIKDAINAAMKWVIAVINSAYGENKLSEEVFREITYTKVFRTNAMSRIALIPELLGHDVWSILAVYPNVDADIPTNILTGDFVSYYYDNAIVKSITGKGAKRLTTEEWSVAIEDPFSAGFQHNCIGLTTYAYLHSANYSSSITNNLTRIIKVTTNEKYSPYTGEIEIRPKLDKKVVAVTYIAVPNEITLETDTIPFPHTLESLIFNKVQNLISRKQGDGTSLFTVTERDISLLIQTLS